MDFLDRPDMNGSIPWKFEEFIEVMDWYQDMISKPIDDWNLKRLGLNIAKDDGSVSRLEFNTRIPEYQLQVHLMEKYDGQDKLAVSHGMRFMQIKRFIGEHRQQLEALDVMRRGDDDSMGINELLFRALCELPWSQIGVHASGGEDRFFGLRQGT